MNFEDENGEKAGTSLEVPMTIPELIQIRAKIIESWKVASESIKGVSDAFRQIRGDTFRMVDPAREVMSGGYLQDYHEYSRADDKNYPHDIERQTKALDFSLWVFALSKLNITNVMTDKARQEFLEKVRKGGKQFNEVEVAGLAQNAASIFQDSSMNMVRDVYRTLIGCHYNGGTWGSGKKDNLRKVEKVFRCSYSDFNHTSHRYYGSSGGIKWNDVLTACRLIEGRGVTDYSNNFYSLVNARDRARGSNEVECEYFHLTAYMNGNVKCRWNEDKLHVLEKLNAIGSGRENAMPDVMRKRYKGEHFANGGEPIAEDYFKPDPEKDPNPAKDFAFFPTPETVAERMVEIADFDDGGYMATLEPSAGDGAIALKIPWGFDNHAVEYNHHRAKALRELVPHFLSVTEADFLTWEPDREFDRIVMNPPFNDRIEAVHIVRAFKMLKPSGVLVAIIPEGWFYRDDLKSRIFREFLTRNEYKSSEKLPKGTFSKTSVETRIISLRKPQC